VKRRRTKTICLCLSALLLAGAALAQAEISQKGNLQVKVSGELAPKRLPRQAAAPVSVSVGGQISTTDESPPPQLKELRIEINRHGRLDYQDLAVCEESEIHPASTQRALSACRSSLVGKGRFWANIVLAGQAPYPTQGRLLVFNGRQKGKPVLLGQIYAPHPFATSFVIPFELKQIPKGSFGTAMVASLPKALGSWGYVTAISLTLSRRYTYQGHRHSYLSAACPAPKGFGSASFPLIRTTFSFAGKKSITETLTRHCGVRG
jgi:hypothetical protein